MKRGLRVEDLKPPPSKKSKAGAAAQTQKAAASPVPVPAPAPAPAAASPKLAPSTAEQTPATASTPTSASVRGKRGPGRGGKKKGATQTKAASAAESAGEKPARGKGKAAAASKEAAAAAAATPASAAVGGVKEEASPSSGATAQQEDDSSKIPANDGGVEKALSKLTSDVEQQSQDPAGFVENAWQELLTANGSSAGMSMSASAPNFPTDGKALESLLAMLGQQNGNNGVTSPPPPMQNDNNGDGVLTNGAIDSQNNEGLSAFEQADQQCDVDLLDFLEADAMGPDSTAGPEDPQADLETLLATSHSSSASVLGDTPELVDSSRASSSTTSSSFKSRLLGPDFGGTSWTSASPVSGGANATLAGGSSSSEDDDGGNSAANAGSNGGTKQNRAAAAVTAKKQQDTLTTTGAHGHQDDALSKIAGSQTDRTGTRRRSSGDIDEGDAHDDHEWAHHFDALGPELGADGQPVQQWAILS